MIILEDETTAALVVEDEPSLLVFDGETTLVQTELAADLLLVDELELATTSVPVPPDFVVIDQEQTSGTIMDDLGRDVILIATAGPAGPPGPAGKPDPSTVAYQHIQPTPATVWTIEHDLGYNPAGIFVFSDGYQIDGFVTQYLTDGVSLRLTFDIPLAGTAQLS